MISPQNRDHNFVDPGSFLFFFLNVEICTWITSRATIKIHTHIYIYNWIISANIFCLFRGTVQRRNGEEKCVLRIVEKLCTRSLQRTDWHLNFSPLNKLVGSLQWWWLKLKMPLTSAPTEEKPWENWHYLVSMINQLTMMDCKLLIFDWAGKEGEARYPSFLNHTNIQWPIGVADGYCITSEHGSNSCTAATRLALDLYAFVLHIFRCTQLVKLIHVKTIDMVSCTTTRFFQLAHTVVDRTVFHKSCCCSPISMV